jgi:hypothetical protein
VKAAKFGVAADIEGQYQVRGGEVVSLTSRANITKGGRIIWFFKGSVSEDMFSRHIGNLFLNNSDVEILSYGNDGDTYKTLLNRYLGGEEIKATHNNGVLTFEGAPY